MLKTKQKAVTEATTPITLDTIHKDLLVLNHNLAKQYKLRHIIWTNLLRGLFTGIGATIMLSIFILLLSTIYSQLNDIPIFHDFFQNVKIEQVIPKS